MWKRVLIQTALVLVLATSSALAQHWQSEVGVINFTQNGLTGVLSGLDENGQEVYSNNIVLPGFGRMELDVARDTVNRTGKIRYMHLDIASGQGVGYQKFYVDGTYRVGLEAKPRAVQGPLYVPHIASNSEWWTGLALLNTGQGREVLFTFDNGQQKALWLNSGQQQAVTIASLFGDNPQPNIGSARVNNGDGLVGLLLFGNKPETGQDSLLSGLPLGGNPASAVAQGNNTARRLVLPHVDNADGWSTSYAVYTPNQLTKTVYTSQGQEIGAENIHRQFAEVVEAPDAGWMTIESTQDTIGFELFGKRDLAGFSVVNIETQTGVFPKIERDEWTGIALVNPSDVPVTVELDARNDSGVSIATEEHQIPPKTKLVKVVQDLFAADITAATYIRFTSTQPLVGFQLSGSQQDTMLDAIPALGSAENLGTQRLYFPHIDYE